jgi:Type IV secretion system pilin
MKKLITLIPSALAFVLLASTAVFAQNSTLNLSGGYATANTVGNFIMTLIKWALIIGAAWTFLKFCWAAWSFVSSTDAGEKTKAKDMLINAVIGFGLVLFIFAIVRIAGSIFGLNGQSNSINVNDLPSITS